MHSPRPHSLYAPGELERARGFAPLTPLPKAHSSAGPSGSGNVCHTAGMGRRASAIARPYRPSPLGGPALSYSSLSELGAAARSASISTPYNNNSTQGEEEEGTRLRASQRSKSTPDTREVLEGSSRRRSVVFALVTPPVPALPEPSRLSSSSQTSRNEAPSSRPSSSGSGQMRMCLVQL